MMCRVWWLRSSSSGGKRGEFGAVWVGEAATREGGNDGGAMTSFVVRAGWLWHGVIRVPREAASHEQAFTRLDASTVGVWSFVFR